MMLKVENDVILEIFEDIGIVIGTYGRKRSSM